MIIYNHIKKDPYTSSISLNIADIGFHLMKGFNPRIYPHKNIGLFLLQYIQLPLDIKLASIDH